MNLRDPKTQISVVIVILFLGFYYIWFAKMFTPFQATILAKEMEKGELLSKLHNVEQKAATLNELQKEYNGLQAQYKMVEVLLPESKEDEAFLSQLHAAAQLTNTIIRDVTPLGTISAEFYETNSYTVEVESSFHGLGKFMAKVANFPFIVTLDNIRLKSPIQNLTMLTLEKIQDSEAVISTFKISTYNVKQGPGL